MIINVGETFPSFEIDVVNKDKEITKETIEPDGQWKVVYFYPKDFTFICPTEICEFDKLASKVRVLGISGDNEFCKLAWRNENDLIGDINHSLGADTGLNVSRQVGVVNPEATVCLRATYILDGANKVKHVSVNELDTGRNCVEIERTLDALLAGGLTGCGWQTGDEFVG